MEPLPDEALDQVQQEARAIVEDAGRDIVITAQQLVPIRTGRLHDSIYYDALDVAGLAVGARTPYAVYIEYGTSKMLPQPFLEPAVENQEPLLQEALDSMVLDVTSSYMAELADDGDIIELERESRWEVG